MTTQHQWTRVVVLRPPENGGLSAALKAEFAQRDWFAVEQTDPHLAMAELCLREKSQVTRAAWGLQRLERIALVVLEPNYWPVHDVELECLIAAVTRYLPNTAVWEVRDDQLLPVNTADHETARVMMPTAAAASLQPAVRGGNVFELADDGEGERQSRELDGQHSISRQEIEMLLEIQTRPPAIHQKGAPS